MRNRREFIQAAATVLTATAAGVKTRAQTAAPAGSGKLAAVVFEPIPLGKVLPTQWLKDQLTVQASGLTGSLEQIFAEVGQSQWIGGSNPHSERGPYYLDGLVPLAAMLPDDPQLHASAQAWVRYVVDHQQPNGMLGPVPAAGEAFNWWPPMPMLKAMTQWYELTPDPTVLTALRRYFAFHAASSSKALVSWAQVRWMDEVYVLQWTYERTGDPTLLALSQTLQKQGYDWVGLFNNGSYPYTVKTTRATRNMARHGVNNGQGIKSAAVQYRMAGDDAQRSLWAAQFNTQLATLDRFHGQPNGMFSCDEFLAGLDPQQGTELCTVAETLFSLEIGLSTFGDPAYADRIEKIAYNALPGLLTEDMWAHQYVGQANQIFSGTMTEDPYATDPPVSNTYGLAPRLGCCTANYHQAWPKLASSLWMRSPADHGLVAAIIAPSQVTVPVGGVPVQVTTATNYPFDGAVRYTVQPASPVSFPLYVRIPAWAGDTSYTVNGKPAGIAAAGAYLKIARQWNPGDTVEMSFNMTPRITRGPGNSKAVSIESGPLVFSYPLEGQWKNTSGFYGKTKCADWKITPAHPFNMALDVDEASVKSMKIIRTPPTHTPFASAAPPVTLSAQGKLLPTWKADNGDANYAETPPASPVTSQESTQDLILVPYGSTRLRITSFPSLRS